MKQILTEVAGTRSGNRLFNRTFSSLVNNLRGPTQISIPEMLKDAQNREQISTLSQKKKRIWEKISQLYDQKVISACGKRVRNKRCTSLLKFSNLVTGKHILCTMQIQSAQQIVDTSK